MSLIQIATPFNIDIEFEQAEFHKRLLAYLIDFGIMLLYWYVMVQLLFNVLDIDTSEVGIALIVTIIPMFCYMFCTELWLNGQSIGKKVLRIKVVSLDGGEPTLGQFLLRAFSRFYEWGAIIMFFFWGAFSSNFGGILYGFLLYIFGGLVSVLFIAVTAKSQRIGDLMAGTVVVNTKTKLSIYDTVFMQVQEKDYHVTFPEVMRLSDRDINTIKGVLLQAKKYNNFDMCNRVAYKVKDVLKLQSNLYPEQLLEKLMEDYNYLATRE